MTIIRNGLRRWVWPLLAGLAAILVVLLWLSPAEQTLGQTVKLVYLHGALVRTALVLFAISVPVNLIALVSGRGGWSAWGTALTRAAIASWLLHTFVSMVTTYATWGVLVAWFEPRTRFTFALAVVGVLILVVTYLVDNIRFSALAYLVLAGLALALAPRLVAIQHPLDAISSSPSVTIRSFYTAILAVSLAMGGLLAIWFHSRLAQSR